MKSKFSNKLVAGTAVGLVVVTALCALAATLSGPNRLTQNTNKGQEDEDIAAIRRTLAFGLRHRSEMLQAVSGVALWARYRTARDMAKHRRVQEQLKQKFPQAHFEDRQGNRAACGYRFVCDRYRWRYEVRALVTGAGNVFHFEGPYDIGEVWRNRVFKVSVCDGSNVFTYDATSNRVVIRQLDDDRPLYLRFPLKEYLLLGYGPFDYSDVENTGLVAARNTEMMGDYKCYVLYGYPPWASPEEPLSKEQLRLWVCPTLGYAVVKAEEVAWSGESSKRDVWLGHDFEQISRGLWLPKRTTRYLLDYSPDEKPLLLTSTMHFYNLRVPELPAEAQLPFHLSIPLGMHVYDRRQNKTYYEGVGGMLSEFEQGPPVLPNEYQEPPVLKRDSAS